MNERSSAATERGTRTLTPGDLSGLAERLFQGGSTKFRLIQKYRPYICPFDVLIDCVPAGAAVMDVGCGGGLFLGLLAGTDRIARGYGFDSNETAIGTASRMADLARRSGYRADLRFEARSAAADWPRETFDVVSLIDVMHHVPPAAQEEVIRKAAARIRPGGRMVYKDMCRRPRWRAVANRLHDLVLAQDWIHYASAHDVVRWAESCGLALKSFTTINLFWYGHELLIFERPGGNGPANAATDAAGAAVSAS